jgi:hypothetical protein
MRLWRQASIALAAWLLFVATPAWASVRLVFWSHDTTSYFPHAFFTLKGTVEATGEPVDTSYGFTLTSLNPLALFTSVSSRIDVTAKSYMRASNAHFAVTLTDAQYASVMALVEEWGRKGSKWNLNRRNCVHFVAEAARRAGLTVVEDKRLMKKPKSFTRSLIPLNEGRVSVIELSGPKFWAQSPEDEIFGVPEKINGKVLGRQINDKRLEQERDRPVQPQGQPLP